MVGVPLRDTVGVPLMLTERETAKGVLAMLTSGVEAKVTEPCTGSGVFVTVTGAVPVALTGVVPPVAISAATMPQPINNPRTLAPFFMGETSFLCLMKWLTTLS